MNLQSSFAGATNLKNFSNFGKQLTLGRVSNSFQNFGETLLKSRVLKHFVIKDVILMY